MKCKICLSGNTFPLKETGFFPDTVEPECKNWWRCSDCGSDSSELHYDDVKSLYNANYAFTHGLDSGNQERLREQVRSNCDWFGHYADHLPNRDFLDIGCCDGSALYVMQSFGWAIHGFDVVEPPYMGPHVTVRSHFNRNWFPNRYGAVLAREVIEHVEDPVNFLHEAHGVLCKHGLFQVQTPKPTNVWHHAIYGKGHLFLISISAMRKKLDDAHFDILDFREWGDGNSSDLQSGYAFLCKGR